MVKVTYVAHDETVHVRHLAPGTNIMEGAVKSGISEIEGDCGGACACATCHIYVDEPWRSQIGPTSAEEDEMLEFVEERRDGSRLGCQIRVFDECDGIVLHMPRS